MPDKNTPGSSPDRRLWADVTVELARDGAVDASDIHVEVDRGVVRLTGMIGSRRERVAASTATLRVVGVAAVIDELTERA
ncbi:BON domain-containing protein [Glaciibacter sp. 2TAF33]|uniref:BON domain-containing protein n=1 Tax=Glaciibacter sp. 2TAF33 TaxID=3233015 RepID=UPI003F919B9B